MSMKIVATTLLGTLLAIGLGAGSAAAQDGQPSVLVYDYAVSHPTDDADLQNMPSIGASVPPGVILATAETGEGVYGYFYFRGRPVIVDMQTRSIVRIYE